MYQKIKNLLLDIKQFNNIIEETIIYWGIGLILGLINLQENKNNIQYTIYNIQYTTITKLPLKMDSELQQLQKAKDLAMDNSPEQMLPKVLETTNSMVVNAWKDNKSNKLGLSRFFAVLLLDTMNHPQISLHEKPLIASQYLITLSQCYNNITEDVHILQLVILTFTKIYPMIFDLVAKTSDDNTWKLLQDLKKQILSRWKLMTITNAPLNLNNDNKHIGIKLAMVKFISTIIITHTPDTTNNSISISRVPDNQPLINKTKLESEAKILLDVIINYLIEEPMMVSSLFIGIINCLSFIMKQRTQTILKILNGIMKFNIDAKYQDDEMDTLNYKLCKRFVERCYKNFVQFGVKNHLIKNSSSNPNMAQLYSKLTKISQTLFIIGEETKSKGILNFDEESMTKRIGDQERERIVTYRSRKRQQQQQQLQPQPQPQPQTVHNNTNPNPPPSKEDKTPTPTPTATEPTFTEDQIKALLQLQEYTKGKTVNSPFVNTSPKATNNTYGSLFSLMNDTDSNQDLSLVPTDILIKLSTEALYKADTKKFITALSIAASRYTDLMNKEEPPVSKSGKRSFDETESTENGGDNKRIKTNEETQDAAVDDTTKQPYFFEPKAMDHDAKMNISKRIITKLFEIKDNKISPSINPVPSLSEKSPLEEIKLINWSNEESWYHILIRLATRGTRANNEISNLIREELLKYVMMDINDNQRVAIIIEWMNEEWYGDLLFKVTDETQSQYNHWSLRLLDELIPFLENKHRKLFIRLMSELPKLTTEHLSRVKPILIDPSRNTLGFQTLKFLIMFRMPVKPLIKPLLETIATEDPTVEPQCRPILDKFYKD